MIGFVGILANFEGPTMIEVEVALWFFGSYIKL